MPLLNIKDLGKTNFLAVTCITSMLCLPRSYAAIKLSFLLLYVFQQCIKILLGKKIYINGNILFFYLCVMMLGAIWSLIGLVHGNPTAAIYDHLRLYIGWGLAYLIFLSLLRMDGVINIHYSVVVSAIIIFGMNLFALLDHAAGFGMISDEIKKELDMFVGIHGGYIQITTHNIGSLFFILPYLTILYFNKNKFEATKLNNEKIALILSLVVALISGRRALWISIILLPFIFIFIQKMMNSSGNASVFKRTSQHKKMIWVLIVIILSLIISFLLLSKGGETISHLIAAFSAEDERTIQMGYLLRSWSDNPLWGTGFGGYAGYTRNEVAPWLYELTYHQILFNFGLLGCSLITIIFISFCKKAIYKMNKMSIEGILNQSIFGGLIVFLIAAYSNPYLGSFDFLFVLGMLPLLGANPISDIRISTEMKSSLAK